MDTALDISGDFASYGDEGIYFISGNDELKQRLYILFSAVKGGFIYDRELGSGISREVNAVPEIESLAREALESVPEAEVVGAEINGGEITVTVMIGGTETDIILRRGDG